MRQPNRMPGRCQSIRRSTVLGVDPSAQKRYRDEQGGQNDGATEEIALDATAGPEHGSLGAEGAAETGPPALHEDDHHQDGGEDDLNDLEGCWHGF